MSILASNPPTNTPSARFRALPWHDSHPAKLELEQRLPPDHLARLVDEVVQRLDLRALRASYGGTGSEPHPPERLLAVVLYEIRRGRHCPAQWYGDARENEPVRWLLRGSVVSRSCWYAFRDRVAPLLLNLNAQVLAQAIEAGLTPATRGAEDGTLVAANASRHKIVSQATLQRHAEVLASACAEDQRQQATAALLAVAEPAVPAPVAEVLAPLPVAHTAEAVAPPVQAAVPPAVPVWLAPSVQGRKQQQQRLQQAYQRMQELQRNNLKKWTSKRKAADTIVVSLSDPEAVIGRDKEKVFRPLYNVQIVDDLDSPLILAYDVFAQQNDAGLLEPMLTLTKQQVGHPLAVLLADASYASGADLAAADAKGVLLYAPVPGDGVVNPKQIPKREFSWQEAEQTYVCPQGHRLEFEESWKEKRVGGGVQVWRYRCPPEHCLSCPLQARCTRTPASGRAVTRQEHEELIEALRARMGTEEAKALYRLRGQNVELVNADWKEHRKLRRFSGRGLARVRCEVGLMVLSHNLLTLQTVQKKVPPKFALPLVANPTRTAR